MDSIFIGKTDGVWQLRYYAPPHDINTINKSILHIHIHIYIERERERVRERERERTKFLEYYLLHP